MAHTSDEYMEGFREGFEFLLLALEGRMELLDEAAAEELAPFLADYRRLADMLRERGSLGPAKPLARVVPKGRLIPVLELAHPATN